MNEIIDVVETHVKPTAELRTMTVQAPNGAVVEAPIEAWIFGLISELSTERQSVVCEKVAQLARWAHSPVQAGQFIHIRPDPTGGMTRIDAPHELTNHIKV